MTKIAAIAQNTALARAAWEHDALTNARAANTNTAYASDWNQWEKWRTEQGLPQPATEDETSILVGYYIDQHRDLSAATLERRVVGIRHGMLDHGHPWPTFQPGRNPFTAKIRSIGRDRAAGRTGVAALPQGVLRQALAVAGDGPKGVRDRAILLTGFLSGLRRSDLARIDLADVTFTDEGMTIHQRRSKTDQAGRGRIVYIPLRPRPDTCAVRACQRWLKVRGLDPGPLFVSCTKTKVKAVSEEHRLDGHTINRIVKAATKATGADTRYTAHSLRAGLATAAGQKGATAHDIARQTGHRDMNMVEHYIRDGRGFEDNVVHLLDL